MCCEEAATELIISHGARLGRADFTRQFIRTQDAAPRNATAVIDWDEAITALQAGNPPAQAARRPSSTWPPASPPQHLSASATPSSGSTGPTST